MKRTTVAKRAETEIHITDSYYTKPERVIPLRGVVEEPIRWLRTQAQMYAGQHKIDEDQVILYFEQREISVEEQLEREKNATSR